MTKQHGTSGFSLIELIVVIGIISILLTIGTISFNDWRLKHNVEAQIREMVSDINEVKIRALTTKTRHSITLNANSYVFRSYSSEGENLSTGGTTIPGGTHAVIYTLKKAAAADYADIFEINQRGAVLTGSVSIPTTIYLEYAGTTPGLNCIKLETIRINPGNSVTIGGICNDR